MSEVIRIKDYKNFHDDGKSFVQCKMANKKVAVCLMLGSEPARIKSAADTLPIDDIILAFAKRITNARRRHTRAMMKN